MAARTGPLRLVNKETGEITEEACPGCFKREEEIASLKTEKRGWISRYYNLKREFEPEQGHELFPAAKRLFDFWKERCNHPRSDFTAERFQTVLPHLRDLGEDLCRRAIEGAAYEPYTTIRKNGTVKRHDDWTLVFRSRDKVEEFANRAPYHLPKPEHIKTLANALMFLGWAREDQAVAEATRRLKR